MVHSIAAVIPPSQTEMGVYSWLSLTVSQHIDCCLVKGESVKFGLHVDTDFIQDSNLSFINFTGEHTLLGLDVKATRVSKRDYEERDYISIPAHRSDGSNLSAYELERALFRALYEKKQEGKGVFNVR